MYRQTLPSLQTPVLSVIKTERKKVIHSYMYLYSAFFAGLVCMSLVALHNGHHKNEITKMRILSKVSVHSVVSGVMI